MKIHVTLNLGRSPISERYHPSFADSHEWSEKYGEQQKSFKNPQTKEKPNLLPLFSFTVGAITGK